MTFRKKTPARLQRWIAAFAAFASFASIAALAALAVSAGLAQAQPVATGLVAPPAQVDTALRGSLLASLRASTPGTCLAECKRVTGCTGYNFATPGPAPGLPGGPGGRLGAGAGVDPRAANCSLMSGTLADAPNRGVVSCRMPCDAGAKGPLANTQPLPGAAILRDPNLAQTRPPLGAQPPPPVAPMPAPAPAPLLAATVPVIVGTYTPPPAPQPAPAPTPRPAVPPPVAAAPAVARTGVSGYEVVSGPMVDIAPLSHALTAAQCAAGKVALSAGWRVTPGGDAQYGLEVRGAMPDGRQATVLVRNANAFVPARGQAFAVCVNAIAGLRAVDTGRGTLWVNLPPALRQLDCAASERLVGGGVMGNNDTMMGSNAQRRPSFDDPMVFGASGLPGGAAGSSGAAVGSAPPAANSPAVWRVHVAFSASPYSTSANFSARALCAPEAAVDGWEWVESATVSLGARSRAEPAIGCPGGKSLLAAGVSQRSDNLLDMVVASIAPQTNTLDWTAQIANRNTIGGGGAVVAGLSALCARRQ